MKRKSKILRILAMVTLVFIGFILISISLWNSFFGGVDGVVITVEEMCEKTGGIIKTQLCCKSVSEFPNTCLVGACGCSPENSHEVKICDCGEGRCFDVVKDGCINP